MFAECLVNAYQDLAGSVMFSAFSKANNADLTAGWFCKSGLTRAPSLNRKNNAPNSDSVSAGICFWMFVIFRENVCLKREKLTTRDLQQTSISGRARGAASDKQGQERTAKQGGKLSSGWNGVGHFDLVERVGAISRPDAWMMPFFNGLA